MWPNNTSVDGDWAHLEIFTTGFPQSVAKISSPPASTSRKNSSSLTFRLLLETVLIMPRVMTMVMFPKDTMDIM